ncbi:MAG TPA: fibronectin type III domain-containing protein [Terriglobales bacterium]|nr:fibronectin type III domain-containing protein [Terriglobales bacterium]
MNPVRYSGYLYFFFTVLMLTACGVPGPPRPPSLDLPQPVADLRALRKGDTVSLAWTVPTETTDRLKVRQLGMTRILRSVDSSLSDCADPVGTVPPPPLPPRSKRSNRRAQTVKSEQTYADQLPASVLRPDPAAEIRYAVCVLNVNARTAGLSNQIAVPGAPAPPPPSDFRAQVTAGGIQLSWTGNPESTSIPGLRRVYRVYRREEGTTHDILVAEVLFSGLPSYVVSDQSFEWEKTYSYRATVAALIHVQGREESEFEGRDTPSQQVFAHDIFPPSVPSGLQAAFSDEGQQRFIDLVWIPGTEADLAGYNVYRREQGSETSAKLNQELVKVPAFRDANVQSGHSYFYSLSAVDARGNQSARSAEVSESVP